MKKIFAILFALMFSKSSFALDDYKQMPEGIYFNDKNHTSITFRVSHMDLSMYTARFAEVKSELIFDPKYPELSKVNAVIYPSSIRTDYPDKGKLDFDKKLAMDENWFNALKFPEIRFVSKKVQRMDDSKAIITGDLSMFGITKSINLTAVFNGAYKLKPVANLPALGFSATTKIKRSDWGFNNYIPVIGDDVEVIIEIEFHKELEG